MKKEEETERESGDERAGEGDSASLHSGQLAPRPAGGRTARDGDRRNDEDQDQRDEEDGESVVATAACRQDSDKGETEKDESRQARDQAGSKAGADRVPIPRLAITRREPSAKRKAKLQRNDGWEHPIKERTVRLLGSGKENRERRAEARPAKN